MQNEDELMSRLELVWQARQREVADKWNRTLGWGDYVVDRWEKAKRLGFGEGTSIYDSSIVLGDVKVGSATWVGPFVILDGSGGLSIGDHCSISAGVQIYSHDSVAWALSGGECGYAYGGCEIGNRCYLGPNVIVAKGVTIGDGCLIGANSLVLESIPPGKKAFGTPCKIIGDANVDFGE